MRNILAVVVVLAVASVALAQPVKFTQDFQSFAPGTLVFDAGYTNLQIRNPGQISVVGETLPDGAPNQFAQWNAAADTHILIGGSNSSTGDFNFDVTFRMRGPRPLNTSWQECLQWDAYIPDASDPSGFKAYSLQIGRHANGGLAFGARLNGTLTPALAPDIPVVPGMDPMDPSALSVAGDGVSKWANLRVQKLGNNLRYKAWGIYATEPAWDDATYAKSVVIANYSLVGGLPPQGGLFSEAGLRFKWEPGIELDNIAVSVPPAGDADGSGAVDLTDFAILKNNFGTGTGWVQGDFDNSGTVDLTDFAILKNHFGQSGAAAAVPEPATLSLLGLGLAGLLRRRR